MLYEYSIYNDFYVSRFDDFVKFIYVSGGPMNKLKEKFKVWSLYYRQEIIWFTIGFILGAICL